MCRSNKGLTLTESLVVIAIIAVLLALSIPAINAAFRTVKGALKRSVPATDFPEPPTTGRQAYLAMDEGAGTTTGGYAITNGQWFEDPDNGNVAYEFEGDTYIDMAGLNLSETAGTVMAWFNGAGGVFQAYENDPINPGGHDRHVWVSGSSVRSRIWRGGNLDSAGDVVGGWHHLAYSWGPAGTRLYIDGQFMNSLGATSSDFNWETGASFGYSRDGGYFTGFLARAAVYNRQLGDGDIQVAGTLEGGQEAGAVGGYSDSQDGTLKAVEQKLYGR